MAALTEKEKMLRGELYHAFSPELIAERAHCGRARDAFNSRAVHVDRITRINLWNEITLSPPIPDNTPASTLDSYPWVEPPFFCDYGSNIALGSNVFINFNCSMLDTCKISIGARTLMGPNVALFAGTHPLEAEVRNGTAGPELGGEIEVGEDCWLGGNVVVLPGVRIGRGSVVGAGSVVTRDVPEDVVVAGNPARVVRVLKGDGKGRVGGKAGEKEDVGVLLKRVEELEEEMRVVKEKLKGLV